MQLLPNQSIGVMQNDDQANPKGLDWLDWFGLVAPQTKPKAFDSNKNPRSPTPKSMVFFSQLVGDEQQDRATSVDGTVFTPWQVETEHSTMKGCVGQLNAAHLLGDLLFSKTKRSSKRVKISLPAKPGLTRWWKNLEWLRRFFPTGMTFSCME